MNFELSEQQRTIQESLGKVCAGFDANYWLDCDNRHHFPVEFFDAIKQAGWLGATFPEEYGGAGLGIADAAAIMQTIGALGAAAVSSVHINIFGPHPIVVFGTPAQKQRWLPPLVRGEDRACFGVTEPDAGLNTTRITTRARRDGKNYVVNGRKIWISTAQRANKIMLITRTTPIEECKKPTDGMTLFYTNLDRKYIEVREIEKMGRHAVDSNALFIDDLPVPEEDRIGEEGKGFYALLHGINPERILVAAAGVGGARATLARAVQYAKERVVFDRPIGQNQAIQHPLAELWTEIEAANLMMWKAASLYDAGKPCGAEANAAKLMASRTAHKTAIQAVLTHGGMGYAKEYHVERAYRESMIGRLAPVSEHLILCFIAEQVLGLPKSY
nr:acyl-CoA dehydrogenase family protein [Rhodoferax sp.]